MQTQKEEKRKRKTRNGKKENKKKKTESETNKPINGLLFKLILEFRVPYGNDTEVTNKR